MIPFYHRVAVIGAGNVGCAISRFLYRRGLTVASLIDRDEMKLERARTAVFADSFGASIDRINPKLDCILICVQDDEIAAVAAEMSVAKRNLEGAFIAHTSGIRSADELRPLSARGAITGAMHPIQSFPSPYVDVSRLDAIGCGIEGDDRFLKSAREFADFLGWNAVVVRKEQKPLYHLACVFAGNFITSLLADSLDLLRESTSGGDFGHLEPMIRGVLEGIGRNSPRAAFTGPVARGDADTLLKHLRLLREYVPELEMLYREFVIRSIKLTRLPDAKRNALMAALEAGDDSVADRP